MTNDYAALVAMLDQAAADLQAEIDAAIDRHGLLVRTAATLRGEAADVDPEDYCPPPHQSRSEQVRALQRRASGGIIGNSGAYLIGERT